MLIKNYVFFSMLVGIMAILLFVLFNFQLLKEMGESPDSILNAKELVRRDFHKIPSEGVEHVQGWVEILDDHRKIVFVKGKKLDSITSYTEKDLNELFYDSKQNRYHASITPFETEERKKYYCLVKIPKENITSYLTFSNTYNGQYNVFWLLIIQTSILFVILFSINVYFYSRWTSSKITNPLLEVVRGIKGVAKGHYRNRLNFKANFELQQIQTSFNDMAERLEKAENEKKHLEESKKRMLVDLSHDLKTPITSIKGYVEALRNNLIKDEEKKKNVLNVIYMKTELVTGLIEDLFELTKLDSPDYPFTKELSDIAEFTRELAVEYYDAFENSHFHFQFEIPSYELKVTYNQNLLYRSLSNILSNALAYNPEGTTVTLKLTEDDTKVYISIKDDGIGISDEIKEKVFDAFFRGDQSRKSNGGTGLGLTITKRIIEMHNGSIQLDSGNGYTHFQIALLK